MNNLNSRHPKILTHKDVFSNKNFFGSGYYVINQSFQLFSNRCPHRGNKIIPPGNARDHFKCGLHGWGWDDNGQALNNNVNLRHHQATLGKSGLIYLDWSEPETARWINDLANDRLEYSHGSKKYGTGDWRWQMEMHVDLLHVQHIHPMLHNYVDCNKLTSEKGYDWIAQYHEHGWWLFIYPFIHIEWEPGCLYFSEMAPRENNQGYDVYIHYLFSSNTTKEKRHQFADMAETTFDEDLAAVNELSAVSKYRMPGNSKHPLEQDILHFYGWLEDNTE